MPSANSGSLAHQTPLATRVVWSLARGVAALFYRVERVGPNVPDGPALLVANHPNGLLDPALVVTTCGRVPRFLAKSTLFSGAPYSFLIRWSGAIPVYRRQDADGDPARNAEMFAAVSRALAAGHAVCLFPEGTSHSTGRLEPLKTGAARIALSAEAADTRVAIVAVGLNFSDKGVFRSPAVIAYGPPFRATDLVQPGDPLRHDAVDALTERIAAHLRHVMVEAHPAEDAKLVSRVERLYAAARGLRDGSGERLDRERLIARGLDALRAHDPVRLAGLVELLDRHDRRLQRFHLAPTTVARRNRWPEALRFVARELPLAVLLLPPSIVAVIVFAVPYLIVDTIARSRRVEHEIQATIKVLGGLIIYAVWTGLLALLVWHWQGGAAAMAAAIVLPALGIGAVFAIEREHAVLEAVRLWWALQRTSPQSRLRLRQRQEELATLLEEAHAWVRERR